MLFASWNTTHSGRIFSRKRRNASHWPSVKNYFNSDFVERAVYPKVAPAINLLALIFLLIEPGATYEFGN
ncbi:MAG: hypothetical protein PVSMB1_03820 [Gemmatimonadaceae bacterium]